MSTRTGHGTVLLAFLVPAVLITVVAGDMVTLMLPSIGAGFRVGEAELAWVVTGFLLMFAVGIPLYGRVADQVSLRRLFVFALLTYALGSVVCALSPTLVLLVAGRIMTGVGAAAIPVLSIIAVTRLLPKPRRAIGIGVLSAATGVGTAVGPAVGGGVGQLLGWASLFWIMAALALLMLPAALRLLPDDRPGGGGPIDVVGALLLAVGSGLVLFGMTQAQVSGFTAPTTWGSLSVAVVALGALGWRTVRAEDPFVPRGLFTRRVYQTGIVVVFLAMAVNLGGLVFVPLLVVEVDGLTPSAGALVMLPAGIVVALLSPLIGRLAGRLGARTVVLTGTSLMGSSSLVLSTFTGLSSLVPAAIGVVGLSIGFILVITTLIGAVAHELPGEQVGIGLGVLQGAQFLGAGTGPAVLGVLVAARQQTGSGAINPFYAGAGSAYSDAFLAMAGAMVVASIIAIRMRRPAPTGARG